jgi:hypothetical protein
VAIRATYDVDPVGRLTPSDEQLPPSLTPCGTCQVILTMLMCGIDEMRCDHKAANPGVCHKC